MVTRSDLPHEGLHLPFTDDGLFRLAPPKEISACTALTLGDAREDSASDARRVFMKLHGYWGHASAHQLKRPLADSEGGKSHLVNYVDKVPEHCETCRVL